MDAAVSTIVKTPTVKLMIGGKLVVDIYEIFGTLSI